MSSERQLRDQAWIGDAVLALFVREWLLTNELAHLTERDRSQLFELFTSNRFLASFGEPTKVEASIGRVFAASGLDASFAHIRETLLERFKQVARNRGFRV